MKRESVSDAACNASKSVTGERSTRAVVLADDDPELLSLFGRPMFILEFELQGIFFIIIMKLRYHNLERTVCCPAG